MSMMNKLNKRMKQINKTNQKAFTLIELLVVIAVLGVLAAGVLTAINPIKRINQANDSRIKSDIGQIAQAQQAYFTTNQVYASTVAALSGSSGSNDLKNEPKVPPAGTASYTVTLKPSGCTTACTDIAVSALINDQASGGTAVWCWDSTNNVAKLSATSPVAGTATCP